MFEDWGDELRGGFDNGEGFGLLKGWADDGWAEDAWAEDGWVDNGCKLLLEER